MNRRTFVRQLSASLGVTLTSGTVAAILSGCRPTKEHALAFLTEDEAAIVGSIGDLIIPDTDTPGARAAGVIEYVDMLLTTFSPVEDQTRVRAQIRAIREWLQSEDLKSLDDLEGAKQDRLMEALDRQAFPQDGEPQIEHPGLTTSDSPLLRTLKPWTIAAYYTSEIGATMELHQPPFGAFDGDLPFSQVGKSWA